MDDTVKNILTYCVPSIKNSSFDINGFNFRLEKAREQHELARNSDAFDEDKLIKDVNDFLEMISMKPISNPKIILNKNVSRKISYSSISEMHGNNKNDIVWIKMTKIINDNQMISVIGAGTDIFFTEKTKKSTISGKINDALGLCWNEEYVYIFPLVNIPTGLNRSDIESGIGNYLISKGYFILDYYSHNY